MKLNIRKKISLLITMTLVISIVILASVTIFNIKKKAASDLESYKEEETDKIKQSLESYVGLAYQSIEANYKNINDKAYIEKIYGLRLQNTVDLAMSIVKKRSEQVKRGEISLSEAQKLAKGEIEAMRYDEGTGYLWINDAVLPYPTMVMHPTVPALNGAVLNDAKFNCAMGKNQNLFQAMAEVCKANGNGFVDYLWPKPTSKGLIPNVQKLSYVALFEEWGWILGTGIYLDDVEEDIVNTTLRDIANLKYDNGIGYFWINDIKQPFPTMVMHPTVPETNGKVLNDAKYNCAKGTNQNFFQLMVEKALEDKTAFVEYMWPKPGSQHDEPKLSFVRHFEPLGWIIGTGVYVDHIDNMMAAKEEEISNQINGLILTILLVSLLLIGAGSFAAFMLANSMAKAIKLVKDRLQDLASGKSIEKLEVRQGDEIGQMTVSLNKLVDGMDAYTSFAIAIGKGNQNAEFTLLSENDTLGNSLIQMRNELKQVAEEESVRKWYNEGVALFGEILRKNNNDLETLGIKWTSALIKYMKANQGSLFILQHDEKGEAFLQLSACYAFDRKKHNEQTIQIGEGMIGQAVLEKEYIYLKDIPQKYVKITSGLGDATPTSLIIVPLISNEEVHGVIEIASFNLFEKHEIEFLQKVGESMASAISSVKINEETKHLLEESQKMAEEIKSQEEELRQNTEEIMATQEELNRKLQEAEQENLKLNEVIKKYRQEKA